MIYKWNGSAWSGLLLAGFGINYTSLAVDLAAKPYKLTVWVHGTNFKTLLPFSHSKFKQTKLEHFSELKLGSESYKRAICLANQDQEQFPTKGFYLFRWPGRLSHKCRKAAGQVLFQELFNLIQKIQKSGNYQVHLTIIAHSYGGGVALELAQQNVEKDYAIQIDRLVLLACPVQDRLQKLVTCQTFKKIFTFYTTSDWLQCLALHGWGAWSGRRFVSNYNLVHIQVDSLNWGFGHNSFKQEGFLQNLPKTLTLLGLKWQADLKLTV